MANTSYLRKEVESYVRAQLALEFGRPFTAELLTLGPGGRHEFDAVASDRSVVASIKSASGLTARGQNPSGKIKDCLAELLYLSLVEAPTLVEALRRRLVLTTPAFYEIFTRATAGAVPVGIEVVCIPLPVDIQAKVDEVVRTASQEVSPADVTAAVATEVETEL